MQATLNTPLLFHHSKRNIKKTTSNAYNSMCLLTFNENKTLVLYIPGSFFLKYWKSPFFLHFEVFNNVKNAIFKFIVFCH